MLVGSLEGVDVQPANPTRGAKIGAAPSESPSSLGMGNQVGHHSGVASVAVGEWMYCDEPVMKPERAFIGAIRSLLDPESRVLQ